MCSNQLLASRFHGNFNLRNKITIFYCHFLQPSWFLSSYTGTIRNTLYFSTYGIESLKWPVMGASTLLPILKAHITNVRRDFGQNRSRFKCFQVQPDYHMLICLVFFIDSKVPIILYIPLKWSAICVKLSLELELVISQNQPAHSITTKLSDLTVS